LKISVITPTADRPTFLKGTYELLKKQRFENWEWLIYDTSLKPISFRDARITYLYDEAIVSIGEKRNRLKEKARGDLIVHFDDDDYYAASYLETVIHHLTNAAFFNFHSWFSYDTKTKQFFYWDTEEAGEIRYHISAISGHTLKEIELGPYLQGQKEELNYKGKTGYGFSFAYTKEVASTCYFEDIDLGEDRNFYAAVSQAGFMSSTLGDQKGEVIHVIHESNTSVEFPQYRVPRFLVRQLIPAFFGHLDQVYGKN
jgi:glycosyltransferase involved in cell wall biosynthesis